MNLLKSLGIPFLLNSSNKDLEINELSSSEDFFVVVEDEDFVIVGFAIEE